VILASRSPQRRAILEQLGVSFEVVVPDAPELETGPPETAALENARRKALAVPGATVLGVDTVVALDGMMYGKPANESEARATLRALSGRVHTVHSGICVVRDGEARTALASTGVEFRPLDDVLLEWYILSGEWRERAGGYAIQGRGAALVARIHGDYSNVVGLPVPTLLELVPDLLSPSAFGKQT
jgi:septum formation protein